jgi:hypothetical protein
MKRTVQVIDEEQVDLDRHLHRYLHHRHHQRQQHHHHDQMIQLDEKVQQIHVIVIQDDNMTVNDDEDNHNNSIDIIIDDQDLDQEDGQFLFFLKRDYSNRINALFFLCIVSFY